MTVAVVLGGVSGMRTIIAPAALALRGRHRARHVLVAAAWASSRRTSIPATPSRIEPAALVARATSGAVVGRTVAGVPGAAAGAGAALAAAFVSHRVRAELGATGVPDPALGVAEDALALSLAWLATRAP